MAKEDGMTWPEYIEQQCSLAHTYAEDGAYSSAARVLNEIASAVRIHADGLARYEQASAAYRQKNRREAIAP